jgi:peptide chain release factor subunit 1
MEEREKIELENLIEELGRYKGRHTELISIYVPAEYSLNLIAKQVEFEKSTAENIKSKQNRKNVQDALERISRQIRLYKQTPKHGLALFAGNVSDVEGQPKIEIWAIEPPIALKTKFYRCDQTFVLDPIKEMVEVQEVYGLLVLDRNEATFGLLEGKSIRVLKRMTSGVPGKIRAGGQSAQRFERVTDALLIDFFRRISESMKDLFFDMKKLKGILIGGPTPTKENFVKEGQIVTALKNKIIALKDLGETDEFGLKMLVDSSADILAKESITKEKEILKKFFTALAKEPEKVVYGKDETVRALNLGAVDQLILSKTLKREEVKELEELALNIDSKLEFVSIETDEGMQFKNIGGIGAILRYAIGEA